MLKIVPNDSWQFDESRNYTVKCSSAGLRGQDKSQLLKRASAAFADKVANLAHSKDETLVHLIAMGATEYYGPNRSGDGFKSATLRKRHDGFVKRSKNYRNHKNKDPKKAYGHVKASDYNEDMGRVELLVGFWNSKEAADKHGELYAGDKVLEKIHKGDEIPFSMACLKAGHLVKCRRGFKLIEEVVPGDEVLTHMCRYQPVYATMRRVKQTYSVIHTSGLGRHKLELTPDHECFVARFRDLRKVVAANSAESAERTGMSKAARRKHHKSLHQVARWLPSGELQPGDLLLMPIYRGSSNSTLTARQARILGYYIAEGSLSTGDNGTVFTVNKKDCFVYEAAKLFPNNKINYNGKTNSTEAWDIVIYDKELQNFCLNEVGKCLKNKIIPESVYSASDEIKLEFLSAWFNGDGWQDDDGLHWSTASVTLQLELQNLLASVGIAASCCRIDHTSDLPGGKKRNKPGTEYVINVSNHYSHLFSGRCKAVNVYSGLRRGPVFITGDYLAVTVASVEFVESETAVYDISVRTDASFTAFGLAVHNCSVPYDICSSCFHKAANRSEYCTEESCVSPEGLQRGGCRTNLTKLAFDGHQLHVDNDQPAFFDISHLIVGDSIPGRPADRIAYGSMADYLEKKACSSEVTSGAELAEILGLWSDETHYGKATKLANLARVLADYEQLPRTADQAILARGIKAASDLSPPTAGKQAGWTALAKNKTIPTVTQFLAWEIGDTTKAAAVQQRLPGIYTRLTKSGKLADVLLHQPYDFTKTELSANTLGWAKTASANNSLSVEQVQQRVVLSVVRQEPLPVLKQAAAAEFSREIEGLATRYAIFKLAMLSAMPGIDDPVQADWLCQLAVLQNQV